MVPFHLIQCGIHLSPLNFTWEKSMGKAAPGWPEHPDVQLETPCSWLVKSREINTHSRSSAPPEIPACLPLGQWSGCCGAPSTWSLAEEAEAAQTLA